MEAWMFRVALIAAALTACEEPETASQGNRIAALDEGELEEPSPCEEEPFVDTPEFVELDGDDGECALTEAGGYDCPGGEFVGCFPDPDWYVPKVNCGDHGVGYIEAFVFQFRFRPKPAGRVVNPKAECRKYAANFLQLTDPFCDDHVCKKGETCKRIRRRGFPPITRDLTKIDWFGASCGKPDDNGVVTCACDFNAVVDIKCGPCAAGGC